jgi:hypothetical protein
MPLLATPGVRGRAWSEGLAVALGDRRRTVLVYLDGDWTAGNEYGWDLREARGYLSTEPCCLVPLPAAAQPAADRSVTAWPPLVAPRLIVASEGRHVAPREASRERRPVTERPARDRARQRARHARPGVADTGGPVAAGCVAGLRRGEPQRRAQDRGIRS